MTIEDLPCLIASVYGALAGLGGQVEEEAVRPDPAVSVRASVKPDYVACLDCGRKMKMLKRHLATEHGLTIAEYRQRWGLAADHPMVAPNYAAKRAELATRIGLGRKPRQAATDAPPKAKKAATTPKAAAAPKARASKAAGSAAAAPAEPKARRTRKAAPKAADAAPAADAKG